MVSGIKCVGHSISENLLFNVRSIDFFSALVNGTGAAWLNAFENAIDMNINTRFVNPDEVINTDCETWIKQVDWVQLNDFFLFYNFPIGLACAESEWDKLFEIIFFEV